MRSTCFLAVAAVLTLSTALGCITPAAAQYGSPNVGDGGSAPHAAMPALDDGLTPAAAPTLGSSFVFVLSAQTLWSPLVPQWALSHLPWRSGGDVTVSAVRPRSPGLLARLRGTWTSSR